MIKLAALGLVAIFVHALASGVFDFPGGTALIQLVILTVLALGLIVAVFDRIIEREKFAMVLDDCGAAPYLL